MSIVVPVSPASIPEQRWATMHYIVRMILLPTRMEELGLAPEAVAVVICREGLHGTRSGSEDYYFEAFDPARLAAWHLGETVVVQYLDTCVSAFLKQMTIQSTPVQAPVASPTPGSSVPPVSADDAPFFFSKPLLHSLFQDLFK